MEISIIHSRFIFNHDCTMITRSAVCLVQIDQIHQVLSDMSQIYSSVHCYANFNLQRFC